MNRAVAAVVRCGPRFLLLLRSRSVGRFPCHWNFPSGMVEPGEPLIKAAERELQEETELSCKDWVFLCKKPGILPNCTVFYFEARQWSGMVRLNDESIGHAWLRPDQLDSLFDKIMPDVDVVMRMVDSM